MTAQLDLARIYTNDEFEDLPDDGNHYELIEGKIAKMGATGDEHGTICGNIYSALKEYARKYKLGKTWFTTGFSISSGNVPEPDVAFVKTNKVPPAGKKAVAVVPDLVVEVQSPSDLASKPAREAARHKIQLYQNVGVTLVWSVNPTTRTVEVYHPQDVKPLVLNITEELNGEEVLPGFTLPVVDIFSEE